MISPHAFCIEWPENLTEFREIVDIMIKLCIVAVAILVFLAIAANAQKILPVPHHNQVFGVLDWTNGRGFVVEKDGKQITKSILYGSCWPVGLTELVAYYHQIPDDISAFSAEVAREYDAYADFDEGAHSWLIPDYLAKYFPQLCCQIVDTNDLKLWSGKRKWKLICDSIDHGWPLIASINWVWPRGPIFGHAIVIRGYDRSTLTAIVNDPAGSFTMTGEWDRSVSGKGLRYNYADFFARRLLIVAPIAAKEELSAMISRYSPPPAKL